MDVDYGLLVSFPDQSESYVLGFEAGQLWEKLASAVGDLRYEATMHTANEESFTRIARHYGCSAKFNHLGNGWSEVSIRRSDRPFLRAVPTPATTGDDHG